MKTSVRLAAFALLYFCCADGHGEKGPLSPEKLRSTATHVIVGKVQAIYTRKETGGDWDYTRYVAEIMPQKMEKGDDISMQRPIYVRYWTRRWAGDPNHLPEDTAGHWGLPSAKDVVRVYAARNAYDGYTRDNNDGGLNVIGGNGFEVLQEATAERKAPQ